VIAYMLVFAGALVLTMGVTPVARWLAPRMGVMDKPEAVSYTHLTLPTSDLV